MITLTLMPSLMKIGRAGRPGVEIPKAARTAHPPTAAVLSVLWVVTWEAIDGPATETSGGGSDVVAASAGVVDVCVH